MREQRKKLEQCYEITTVGIKGEFCGHLVLKLCGILQEVLQNFAEKLQKFCSHVFFFFFFLLGLRKILMLGPQFFSCEVDCKFL